MVPQINDKGFGKNMRKSNKNPYSIKKIKLRFKKMAIDLDAISTTANMNIKRDFYTKNKNPRNNTNSQKK